MAVEVTAADVLGVICRATGEERSIAALTLATEDPGVDCPTTERDSGPGAVAALAIACLTPIPTLLGVDGPLLVDPPPSKLATDGDRVTSGRTLGDASAMTLTRARGSVGVVLARAAGDAKLPWEGEGRMELA